MTRPNVVINAFPESRETLRELSRQSGKSMRLVLEEVLEVHAKLMQGTETRRLKIVLDVEVCKGYVKVSAVEAAPYKPWLGRTDADDIEELEEDLGEVKELENTSKQDCKPMPDGVAIHPVVKGGDSDGDG